jgi:hypothetical protein
MNKEDLDAFGRLKRLAINNFVATYELKNSRKKTEEEIVKEWKDLYEREFDITFDDMKGA